MEPQTNEARVWSVRFDPREGQYTSHLERDPLIYYYETEAEAAKSAKRLNEEQRR